MANRKKWNELPTRVKVTAGIAAPFQLGMLIAAQRDIARRPAEQIRGSKNLWRLATLVNFIGPAVYFAFGRKKAGPVG
jgi:hypothetical protein